MYKVKLWNFQLKSIEDTFQDLRLGEDFIGLKPKAWSIERKVDKLTSWEWITWLCEKLCKEAEKLQAGEIFCKLCISQKTSI